MGGGEGCVNDCVRERENDNTTITGYFSFIPLLVLI